MSSLLSRRVSESMVRVWSSLLIFKFHRLWSDYPLMHNARALSDESQETVGESLDCEVPVVRTRQVDVPLEHSTQTR